MTINRGLPVNLPKAALVSGRGLRESFNVTVDADGTLFLNKEPTTLGAAWPAGESQCGTGT